MYKVNGNVKKRLPPAGFISGEGVFGGVVRIPMMSGVLVSNRFNWPTITLCRIDAP